MSALEWTLTIILAIFYFACLFTVCALTFQKGHLLLGILGIFLPFLWLLGAVLPARTGSRLDAGQRAGFT